MIEWDRESDKKLEKEIKKVRKRELVIEYLCSHHFLTLRKIVWIAIIYPMQNNLLKRVQNASHLIWSHGPITNSHCGLCSCSICHRTLFAYCPSSAQNSWVKFYALYTVSKFLLLPCDSLSLCCIISLSFLLAS